MSNNKKFIAKNGLLTDNIEFVKDGKTLNVSYTNGKLEFNGAKSILKMSDTGQVFELNDVSGKYTISVDASGTIKLAETAGNVIIGSATDNGNKLQVQGNASVSNTLIVSNVSELKKVAFNKTTNVAVAEGELAWNSTDGTLDLGLHGGNTTLQVGQELVAKAYNGTGATIPNGSVVRVTGSSNGALTIEKAAASSKSLSDGTIGVCTESIPNNGTGYVTIVGKVRSIDTSAIAAGSTIWLSTTAGQFSASKPQSPNNPIRIGWVTVSSATVGEIFVDIMEISNAGDVVYNNSTSHLTATNVQSALDELQTSKASVGQLASNLIQYGTTTVDVDTGYAESVSSTDDPKFNTTAVDVTLPAVTSEVTPTLLGAFIGPAGTIKGNPGAITVTTVGNIRKQSGTNSARFFMRYYRRDSSGVEHLLGESGKTPVITSTTFNEESASALLKAETFGTEDRIVTKLYGIKEQAGGDHPVYQIKNGGANPSRTLIPVPVSVIPSDEAKDIILNTTNFNGVLGASDDRVQKAIDKLDDHDHDSLYEPKNVNIQGHIARTDNPHNVTKNQVGLGNVDNTSDADKPISTATQTALNDLESRVANSSASPNDILTKLKTVDGPGSGLDADLLDGKHAAAFVIRDEVNTFTANNNFTANITQNNIALQKVKEQKLHSYNPQTFGTVTGTQYKKIATVKETNGALRIEGLIGGQDTNQGRADVKLQVSLKGGLKVLGSISGIVGTSATIEVRQRVAPTSATPWPGELDVYLVANDWFDSNLQTSSTGDTILLDDAWTSTIPSDAIVWNLRDHNPGTTKTRVLGDGLFVATNEVWHAGNLNPDTKLDASAYTASDVLTKIKTVDGSGSGLDADLLDGNEGAHYLDWNNTTNKPSTYTPSAHTHVISDVSGLQAFLDGKLAKTETAADSSKLDGQAPSHYLDWNNLTNKPSTFAPGVHNHTISDVTGLQVALDGKLGVTGVAVDSSKLGNQTPAYYLDWGNLTNKPTSFNPSAHTHTIGDVTGLQPALDAKAANIQHKFDAVVDPSTTNNNTEGYANSSVWYNKNTNNLFYCVSANSTTATWESLTRNTIAEIDGLQAALDGKAASTHTHAIADVTGLQPALDGKVATTAYTDANVLTKIKNVDGSGSGLDADLLDGNEGAHYLDWNNQTNKPTEFPPASHSHGWAEITGLAGLLNNKANLYHSHEISDVTGLRAELDEAKQSGGSAPTPHRYWRVMMSRTGGSYIRIREVHLKAATGNAVLTDPGLATSRTIYSSQYSTSSSYRAASAFDGTDSTWRASTATNEYVGWDFGAGNEVIVNVFGWENYTSSYAPTSGVLQYSDDNINWFDDFSVEEPDYTTSYAINSASRSQAGGGGGSIDPNARLTANGVTSNDYIQVKGANSSTNYIDFTATSTTVNRGVHFDGKPAIISDYLQSYININPYRHFSTGIYMSGDVYFNFGKIRMQNLSADDGLEFYHGGKTFGIAPADANNVGTVRTFGTTANYAGYNISNTFAFVANTSNTTHPEAYIYDDKHKRPIVKYVSNGATEFFADHTSPIMTIKRGTDDVTVTGNVNITSAVRAHNITSGNVSITGNNDLNFTGSPASTIRGVRFNNRPALTADATGNWLRINPSSMFGGTILTGKTLISGNTQVTQHLMLGSSASGPSFSRNASASSFGSVLLDGDPTSPTNTWGLNIDNRISISTTTANTLTFRDESNENKIATFHKDQIDLYAGNAPRLKIFNDHIEMSQRLSMIGSSRIDANTIHVGGSYLNFTQQSTSSTRGILFDNRYALTAGNTDSYLRINTGQSFTNGVISYRNFTVASGDIRLNNDNYGFLLHDNTEIRKQGNTTHYGTILIDGVQTGNSNSYGINFKGYGSVSSNSAGGVIIRDEVRNARIMEANSSIIKLHANTVMNGAATFTANTITANTFTANVATIGGSYLNFTQQSTSSTRGILFDNRYALTAGNTDSYLRLNAGQSFTNGVLLYKNLTVQNGDIKLGGSSQAFKLQNNVELRMVSNTTTHYGTVQLDGIPTGIGNSYGVNFKGYGSVSSNSAGGVIIRDEVQNAHIMEANSSVLKLHANTIMNGAATFTANTLTANVATISGDHLNFTYQSTSSSRGIRFDGRYALTAGNTDSYLRLNIGQSFTNGVISYKNFTVQGGDIKVSGSSNAFKLYNNVEIRSVENVRHYGTVQLDGIPTGNSNSYGINFKGYGSVSSNSAGGVIIRDEVAEFNVVEANSSILKLHANTIMNGATTFTANTLTAKVATISGDRLNFVDSSASSSRGIQFDNRYALTASGTDSYLRLNIGQSFTNGVISYKNFTVQGGDIKVSGSTNQLDIAGASIARQSNTTHHGSLLVTGTHTGRNASYGINFANSGSISSNTVVGGISIYDEKANFPTITTKNAETIIYASNSPKLTVNTSSVMIGSHLIPSLDGTYGLGLPSNRWGTVYASSGTINTSDKNLKTDIEELSEAEIAVASEIAKMVRKFRFKDRVENEGDDARIHVGWIVQDIMEVFKKHNLDPYRYSMICKDTFEENGETVERYALRYSEVQSFVLAGLEARLEAAGL